MRNFSTKADNTAPLSSGILTAEEDNVRFLELEQAVSTAGITLDGPSGPDTDTAQLAQAMARYASGGINAQDGGAANAYVLSALGSFQPPKAYFTGMTVRFYPAYSNDDASTINAFSLGAKQVYASDGTALEPGDISADVLTEATYDTTLNSGAGAFKLSPWSVLLANVAGGTALYEGREDGRHKIRSLEAGTNVTLTLVETDVGSGDYRVRISAAAGGGGGGGSPHENVGSGAQVHKTNDGTYDELRSIVGGTGITLTQNTDEIEVKLANIAAWTIWLRNAGTTGAPAATLVTGLTDEPTPATTDKLILGKAADGALRSVTVSALRGSSSGGFVASGYATIVSRTSMSGSSGVNATLTYSTVTGALSVAFGTALSSTRYHVQVWRDGASMVQVETFQVSSKTVNGFDIIDTGDGISSSLWQFYVMQIA